jgi:hypothetical protein
MKGKIRKAGSTGWNSSDSEDDNKKNISSDEEDLQKAVQDLGLVIIDCEDVNGGHNSRSKVRNRENRKSRSKSLTNITKRAFISIFPSKKDKFKDQPRRRDVTLDDFPDVPTHPIYL